MLRISLTLHVEEHVFPDLSPWLCWQKTETQTQSDLPDFMLCRLRRGSVLSLHWVQLGMLMGEGGCFLPLFPLSLPKDSVSIPGCCSLLGEAECAQEALG